MTVGSGGFDDDLGFSNSSRELSATRFWSEGAACPVPLPDCSASDIGTQYTHTLLDG
jgi:hypothetical protein